MIESISLPVLKLRDRWRLLLALLFVTLILQWLVLRHSPVLITEVQFAASPATLIGVLENWQARGLTRFRVAGAVLLDIGTILCYVPLLLFAIERLRRDTDPRGWRAATLIAGGADLIENGVTLVLL